MHGYLRNCYWPINFLKLNLKFNETLIRFLLNCYILFSIYNIIHKVLCGECDLKILKSINDADYMDKFCIVQVYVSN